MSDDDHTADDPSVGDDPEPDDTSVNDGPEPDDTSVNDGPEPDDTPTTDDAAAVEETTPLSGLRDRIEGDARRGGGRQNGAGRAAVETGDSDDDPFENVEVGDVDGEALWDAVLDEAAPQDPTPEGEAEPVAADPEGDDHVVDKREFCQRCEYFSAPPDVACSHEGTEILELVDTDHFCVRNCPKVEANDDEFGGDQRR
jgi:hypothetical protein